MGILVESTGRTSGILLSTSFHVIGGGEEADDDGDDDEEEEEEEEDRREISSVDCDGGGSSTVGIFVLTSTSGTRAFNTNDVPSSKILISAFWRNEREALVHKKTFPSCGN